MNMEPGGPGGTESSGREARQRNRPGVRKVSRVVPVVTLLAGVALGTIVAGVVMDRPPGETGGDPGRTTAGPAAPRSPAATVPPGREVSVPGECLAALDRGDQAMEIMRRGLRALTDLDGPRLESVVDELQRIQPEYQRLAERCRAEAEIRTAEPTMTPS